MDVMGNFSARLRRLRTESNLSQAQLAEKLGVSRGSISYYENKDRVPDIVFADAVSCYFGVSIDYLFGYSAHRTRERAGIGDRLDLSEDAITILEAGIHNDVLNRILPRAKFGQVLEDIRRYLRCIDDYNELVEGENLADALLEDAYWNPNDELSKQLKAIGDLLYEKRMENQENEQCSILWKIQHGICDMVTGLVTKSKHTNEDDEDEYEKAREKHDNLRDWLYLRRCQEGLLKRRELPEHAIIGPRVMAYMKFCDTIDDLSYREVLMALEELSQKIKSETQSRKEEE